jgi:diketogulonate reductase-like aldo/keto reductase
MLLTSAKACSFCVAAPIIGMKEIMKFNKKNTDNLQRAIPSTGELVPAIGMGTWQTFDVGSQAAKLADLEEVLRLFIEAGGKVIDSSPMYGSSEEVLGILASKLNAHKSLFLASKVWTTGVAQGKKQMQKSMELMQSDKLDLMQVHNLLDYKIHLKTLQQMKEEGKIRYIGITHYTTGAYQDLMRVIKEYPVDFVQFNYSIQTREAEDSILPFSADNGVGVIINRPYEGGGLFSRVKGKELPEWAAEFDCNSWGQFFLKYIISHPAVTCAIPATDNPKHLKDNMGAMSGNMPDKNTRKKMVDFFQRI